MSTSNAQLLVRKYKWKYAGMIGYFIQRLTGVALLGYLLLHVHTINQLKNPEEFEASLKMFRAPLFKLGEIGLLATVILHALNGVRLTLVDCGVGLTKQRQMFWFMCILVGAVVFIAGAVPMFMHAHLVK